MYRTISKKKMMIFLIISLIIFYFPSIFVFINSQNSTLFSAFFENYIINGNSFFIPFLPNYDLSIYYPNSPYIFHFTLGHLIDIIILVNILAFIDTICYHFIKIVFIENKLQLISYINFTYSLNKFNSEINQTAESKSNDKTDFAKFTHLLKDFVSNNIIERSLCDFYYLLEKESSFIHKYSKKKKKRRLSDNCFVKSYKDILFFLSSSLFVISNGLFLETCYSFETFVIKDLFNKHNKQLGGYHLKCPQGLTILK